METILNKNIRRVEVYRINGFLVVANRIEDAIATWREWTEPDGPDILNIERVSNDIRQTNDNYALTRENKEAMEYIVKLEANHAEQVTHIERLKEKVCRLQNDIERICEGKMPTVEQIKSVHAAAGIMEQMGEHTCSMNLNELWSLLKEWHKGLTGSKEIGEGSGN